MQLKTSLCSQHTFIQLLSPHSIRTRLSPRVRIQQGDRSLPRQQSHGAFLSEDGSGEVEVVDTTLETGFGHVQEFLDGWGWVILKEGRSKGLMAESKVGVGALKEVLNVTMSGVMSDGPETCTALTLHSPPTT